MLGGVGERGSLRESLAQESREGRVEPRLVSELGSEGSGSSGCRASRGGGGGRMEATGCGECFPHTYSWGPGPRSTPS